MNLSCELPKLGCLKKPTKTDIDKLKAENIVPAKLIDSIFKDLEKDYNLLKKGSKSKGTKSIGTKSIGTKSIGTKSIGTKSIGTRTKTKSKSKTKGGRRSTRKNMSGGELTKYKKDKITDMVILLVAGSSYWFAVPMLESWIISIGILPKLCGQNMLEHISSSLFAPEGQSCSARANRYNTIMSGFVALITGSVWYSKNKFTKENLTKNYKRIHHFVKKTIFGPTSTPTPEASPNQASAQASAQSSTPPYIPLTPQPLTPTPPPTSRTGRSKHQQKVYEEEEEEQPQSEEFVKPRRKKGDR